MPRLDLPDVRIDTVDAGSLWLDGGAMFGVVPKPLWSRRAASDERNRIPLAMRCLLVRTAEATVLIDTGVGSKENEKFRDIYRIDAGGGEGGETRLENSLRGLGVELSDIDVVVSTHLHFDHAGGNTRRTGGGEVVPVFPSAVYAIRRGEWDFAHLDNERVRASYLPDNFVPLERDGRVKFVEEDSDIVPGVRVIRAPGHTPWHQVVLLGRGEQRLLYLADLVPTTAHLPLPWIMGYDVEPLVTLESKREVLAQAVREGWWVAFEHDPSVAWGRLSQSAAGRVELVESQPDLAVPSGMNHGEGT